MPAQPLRIDLKRDVERARHRYLQMTKSEIVERLLLVEQSYAENQEQFAQLQFEFAEMQPLQKGAVHQGKTLNQKYESSQWKMKKGTAYHE